MKKKIFAAIFAAAVLCAGGCGGEEAQTSTSAASTSEAPASVPETTASASEITAAVLEKVEISSAIEKGVDDLEYYFTSLDVSGLEEASYYMCASGAYPDEIAVLKFSSDELAEAGLAAVQERMEQQRSTYETYTPDEMYKFDGAVAETRGNYIVYLITADNSAAEEIIGQYIA